MMKRLNCVVRLFSIASLLFLLVSLGFRIFFPNSATDLQLHDTYIVVTNSQLHILISVFFGVWALLYYFTPSLISRQLNKFLSQLHFYVTFIGIAVVISLSQYSLIAGVPRRYYSFDSYESSPDLFSDTSGLKTIVILAFLVQFVFIINLIYSLVRNRKFDQNHH